MPNERIQADSQLIYPSTLQNSSLNPAAIQFAWFDMKDNPPEPTKQSPLQVIWLSMPEHAANPSTVNWDNEKMGFIGEAAVKLGKGGNSSGDVQAFIDGAQEKIKANALVNLTNSLISGLGGNQITSDGLMGAASGKINNPYLTVVFRGVDFRNFTFVFKFTPLTEDDCDTINKIIQSFRSNSLPIYLGGGNAFMQYPNVCQIQYIWEGRENPWMHRFMPAFCTGLDVDYSSAGTFSALRNGFPTCITVTTKWTEMTVVTRRDVEDSTDGFNRGAGF